MKIFMTGAQCTGKSTLCRMLGDALPDHSIVSPARIVFEKYTGCAEKELDVSRKIKDVMQSLFYSDKIISDRFFTDVYAYSSLYNATKDELDELGRLAREYSLESDSLVCYLPIEFDFVPDGVRYPQHREDIDKLILQALRKYKVRFIIVKGSRGARFTSLLSYLKKGFWRGGE